MEEPIKEIFVSKLFKKREIIKYSKGGVVFLLLGGAVSMGISKITGVSLEDLVLKIF